jgi:sulfur-carrier protein
VRVEITLPGLLAESCTGGERHVFVEATTVAGALDALLAAHPLLRVHLYDESMRLRRHVLVFYNDTSTKLLPSTDVPLQDGDRLTVVQAVSGG